MSFVSGPYREFSLEKSRFISGTLFSYVDMPAKFELHLLSISTVINHAWCIMPRFVIFILDAIFHILS